MKFLANPIHRKEMKRCPHKNLCMNVHNNIIHNGHPNGGKHPNAHLLIDEKKLYNVAYPYSGVLFINNKKLVHAATWNEP